MKFKDDPEYYYGEKKFFNILHSVSTCPDNNHPHAIDLDLPSGTKWSCCNVGASAPEVYGNYYAWGEIQPKSVYNNDTYAYWHDNDGNGVVGSNEYVNIGSDIAGTCYDAATANWGAPWRMPSEAQIGELMNNTTMGWTYENGVSGYKFTGSNGNTVFFPAAGSRWDSELHDAQSEGRYWLSTTSDNHPEFASYFNFRPAFEFIYDSRSAGLSVRPVR